MLINLIKLINWNFLLRLLIYSLVGALPLIIVSRDFFLEIAINSFLTLFFFYFVIRPLVALPVVLFAERETPIVRTLIFPIVLFVFIVPSYFWGLWTAFCCSLTTIYGYSPDGTFKWFYYLIGFYTCGLPLGFISFEMRRLSHLPVDEVPLIDRGVGAFVAFVSLPFLTVIITYIVFSIWPSLMSWPYGWFINWFLKAY